MKKISETLVLTVALIISGGLIAGLAAATNYSDQTGVGQRGYHGKIKALEIDTNKDGSVSQEEFLNHNTRRFMRLDSDENGSISQEEFNERLLAMFERMDLDGNSLLSSTEMPRRFQKGYGHYNQSSKQS